MGWSLSGGCSRRTCLPVGPREMLASVLGSEQAPARCALHSALAKKVLLVLNVLWSSCTCDHGNPGVHNTMQRSEDCSGIHVASILRVSSLSLGDMVLTV